MSMEGCKWFTLCKTSLFMAILQHGYGYNVSRLADHVTLKPNVAEVVEFNSSFSTEFEVTDILSEASFVLFQVHTQSGNCTVSLTAEESPGNTESGRHVGLVKKLNPGQTTALFYVNSSTRLISTRAVVSAMVYNKTFPIPGGCNIEFPLVEDPNIRTYYTETETVIQFEYASYNSARNSVSSTCESSTDQSHMSYDVYVYFMPENNLSEDTFISEIQKMMTVDDVTEHGKKIRSFEYNKGLTNLSVPSFPGHGTVYSVVVRQSGVNSFTQTAAYVASTSYACSFDTNGPGKYCYDLDVTETQIVYSVLGVFGLFICFFGHRCFKFEIFVFGFLTLGLTSYVLLGRFTAWNSTALMAGSLVGAVIGGILWLLFWWYVGIPVLSVLLGGFCSGFLFTAVIFNLTPVGELAVFTSPFNFGMAFACGVLALPVLLLAFTRTLSVISCALVGSYATILVPNVWIGGTLQYIVTNIYRKCTVPDFITAVLIVPIHWQETILLVGWGTLFIGGVTFQLYREWNRPKFPPCPRKVKNMQSRRPTVRQSDEDRADHEAPPPYSEYDDFDERTPLTRGGRSRPVNYDHWPPQQELDAQPSYTRPR